MIVDQGKYYLYRHVRLDKNEPFYIGIGTKRLRAGGYYTDYERAFEISGRNQIWKKVVKKTAYKVDIVLESDNELFIKEKEKELIKLYGRLNKGKGILVNLTDGGEGTFGCTWSEEKRKQMTIIGRNFRHTSASKEKISIARKLNPPSQEHIDRFKVINIGRKHKPDMYIERAAKRVGVKCPGLGDKLRLIRLPQEKRLKIKNMLERLLPKKYICFLENTSIPAINYVIKEHNIVEIKPYVREDGLSFYTEKEACLSINVKQKTVSSAIKRKYFCGGFKWFKINPNFTEEELLKLKTYRR